MKKCFYFFALVSICLSFVQCETLQTQQNSTHKGHEYVDLGLSVKWATCNVGATTPDGLGDYFAWGEVEPKDYYGWSTYKYGSDENQLTKYCFKSDYGTFGKDGFVDLRSVLWPEDDAASVNWGGKWRTPTAEEIDELYNNCTWTWTTQNNMAGYLVTSKIKGYTDRSIFLPAAGIGYEDTKFCPPEYWEGFYWTSSLDINHPNYAYMLSFSQDRVDWIILSEYFFSFDRYFGSPVRAVYP